MTKNSDDLQFRAILLAACSKIEPQFMEVRAVQGVSYWSERVYAYELYHQLRLTWPGNGSGNPSYSVNGEVPKTRNPVVKLRKTPDLLIHVPTAMEHNLAAIEIKPFHQFDRVTKDLQTLSELRSEAANYKSAYLIIFGGTAVGTLEKWKEIAEKARFQPGQATIICHPAGGVPHEIFSCGTPTKKTEMANTYLGKSKRGGIRPLSE